MALNSFVSIFGWALIHSLWQAAIIFLALHVSLSIFRQTPAHIKYLLAYLALAGIFLCFLFTFYILWDNHQSTQQMTVSAATGWGSIEAVKGLPPSQKSSGFDGLQAFIWIDYFVLLYGAGLIFFIGKIVKDTFVMQRIRQRRIRPFDSAWEHYLDKLRISWKIPARIKLFLSEYVDVPVVIGYLKPVIYLPFITATHLLPEQIEAILLHELAHIKRYDFVANIFQTLIETILFFNPFVWMISKIIHRERENACDDLVLSATRPALYAETLLALAENQLYKGNFVLAATGKKQQLFQRIKRIMEMKNRKLNIMQRLLVIFILAAGIISVSWLVPGEKENHQPETKAVILKTYLAAAVKQNADTGLLPVPPAPPLVPPPAPSSVPLPPPAPANLPAPPMPMISVDTFPDNSLNDSAISSMQYKMQQYFNSDAWKKYQKDLQSYQQHIQKYFQSREWRKHQQEMQKLSIQMGKMAHQFDSSAEWKAYRDALNAEANKMSEMFNNPKWKASMDSLRQRIGKERINMDSIMVKNRIKFSFDKANMDSIMTVARKNLALERMRHPRMFLFGNGHAVNPNEIVHRMKQDGLIKNDHNFSIKLNEKGLYINGKKQSQTYFEKYRDLIGQHTHLNIRKKGSHLETSINTDENSADVRL